MEYVQVRQLVDRVALQQSPDRFIWRWCPSGQYSASSAYKALCYGQTSIPGARELWKSRAPNKCKFYLWLVIHGRCWTSHRLQRHGLPHHGPCALCSQEAEELNHLLAGCVTSREIWYKVLRRCGWQQLTPGANDHLVTWWIHSRKQIPKPRRKAFDSLVILVTWTIWLERNDRVFKRKVQSPTAIVDFIWSELAQYARAKLIDWAALLPGGLLLQN